MYHDAFCDAVREQLLQVDAVLVWVNPIEGGRDRSVLVAMLREVAAAGVFVSAHPDVILTLGTKEVLYQTRELGWGADTHLYRSLELRPEWAALLMSASSIIVAVNAVLLRNVERELGGPAPQSPASSGRPAHAA